MRPRHHLIASVGLGILALLLIDQTTQADALFSVTNVGPANPSPSFLDGANPSDSSGNYLSALGPSDQAAFKAGSFDPFAHSPTTYVTDSADNGAYMYGQPLSYFMTAGNNKGQVAGIATYGLDGAPNSFIQVAMFDPSPHTVPVYPDAGSIQYPVPGTKSPGYVSSEYIPPLQTSDGYVGAVTGLNDKGIMILNHSQLHTASFLPWAPMPTYSPSTASPWVPVLLQTSKWGGQTEATLGSLGGGASFASALNNSNQVVGWSQLASGAQHAFLYANGQMQDLNALISSTSGITLTDAVGIDGSGRIVAFGTDASGKTEEYLLTPQGTETPEPSTLLVFAVAIVGIATRHLGRGQNGQPGDVAGSP